MVGGGGCRTDAMRVLFGEVDEGDTEEWLKSLADKSLLEIRTKGDGDII